MGTAMTSPDSEPMERLLVGSGAFLVGLTSAGVLHHATRANPAATRAFRMGAFAVDLAVVSIGTAGVMVAGVNLAPLQVERRRPRLD